jgi:membrane associated rhomboid family serine protease
MSQYFASAFRRRPNQGWFRVGRFDATTVDVICGAAVFTMFMYGLLGRARWFNLVFFPPAVRDGLDVWRIVTWSTATQPDFWPLLGIVFFWLFGQDIEAMMGRNRFLGWFVAVTIVPAVLMTVLGGLSSTLDRTTAASGLQLIFLGALWLYAATYPNVRWFEIVPLWAIAAVFSLLNLLRYSGDNQDGMVVFVLFVIAASMVAGRSLGVANAWPIPHIPLGGSSRKSHRRPARPRRSSARSTAQTVVEGPWTATPPRSTPDATAAQAELDVLLDKISASGLDSLSSDEKRRLNELSKRLR